MEIKWEEYWDGVDVVKALSFKMHVLAHVLMYWVLCILSGTVDWFWVWGILFNNDVLWGASDESLIGWALVWGDGDLIGEHDEVNIVGVTEVVQKSQKEWR